MAGACAQFVGPEWPWRGGAACFGWARHNFNLRHACGALANRGTNAVRARVATTDDEDFLAFCVDGERGSFTAENAVLSAQEFEREINAAEFASGDFEIARGGRADCEDDGLERTRQIVGGDVLANFGIRHKADAFGFEDFATAVDEGLVEFEVGDAITKEAADVAFLFVDGHVPTLAAQGARGGKSRRARTDDCDALAIFCRGRFGLDPAVRKGRVDNELFRLAHHNRFFVELANATRFAKGRANARREFGEVAILREEFVGAAHVALEDGAILVGDEIAEWTARAMAEGDAAVLAAFDLCLQICRGQEAFDLFEIGAAFSNRTVIIMDAIHCSIPFARHYSFTGTTLTKQGR